MFALATPRLIVSPLPEKHLRLALLDWQELEKTLNLQVTVYRPEETIRQAMAMKLDKMALEPGDFMWYTYWLIILKSGKRAIGMFGFKGSPDGRGEVEIGYGIQPEYRGHGYMTEAAKEILAWAFVQKGGLSVTAETLKTNLPSQRVLEKLGFKKFGETQMAYWWKLNASPMKSEG